MNINIYQIDADLGRFSLVQQQAQNAEAHEGEVQRFLWEAPTERVDYLLEKAKKELRPAERVLIARLQEQLEEVIGEAAELIVRAGIEL